MEAYLLEWLNLLLRWTHLIVGIAWIGSSFYFVWLDAHLNTPPRDPEDEGVAGDLWAVHGGGFYHAQKYKAAPDELPSPLHWFKWEAYATWLTGFALLVVMYYVNADVYLVDKAVADIPAPMAVGVSVGLILLSWVVYDLLCRTRLSDAGIGLLGFVFLVIAIYAVSHIFSGRGAYIQIGAMLGTIMVANVFMVIIPGQRELVNAKLRGEEPDPLPGMKGKQRSMHNNYLTLPVLFVMLSPHYPMTYAHEYNWLILVVLFIVGVLIRHFFNLRNQGKFVPALPAIAIVIIVILAFAITPKSGAIPDQAINEDRAGVTETISFSQVNDILVQRCNVCHSATPDHPTAPIAPNGVMFDTVDQIKQWAGRIHDRTVVTKTMPLANLTNITEEERRLIHKWYVSGAQIE